jgi:gamma-glutamylcyclotransferase (GGCT)/AIG2-like uncharacterized protein YtfP
LSLFVFFYGTLMRMGANHRVLIELGARFVTEAKTCSPRVLVDLGPYPALLPDGTLEGACCVAGEVFEIDEAMLGALDEFEGVPLLYTRESIALEASDGRALTAFVYVLARRPPARARPIADGRYRGRGVVLEDGASPEQLPEDDVLD